MTANITHELAALRRMTPQQLRQRYVEVFGEQASTKNKGWLLRRIAWRLQCLAEGDLSERARQRAAELANDADLRTTPPKGKADDDATADAGQPTQTRTLKFPANDRLPPPGTIITRLYKGQTLQVQILAKGFEHDGQVFASLSAVAKHVTGSHCNGYLFFRIGQKGGEQ
jgi:hypothetical protein